MRNLNPIGSVYEAVGDVLKKGRDLTYLLRWTAKPGAVMGDPTAYNNDCVRGSTQLSEGKVSKTNLARILAHVLDVNPTRQEFKTSGLELV
jgi:hypothetical protein